MKSSTLRFDLQTVAEASWLLLCVLLPISGGLVPVPLAIAIILCAVIGIRRIGEFSWRRLWPLYAYYALHVIGLAWSTDIDFGLFDVQIKAGLVLLPFAGWAVGEARTDILRRTMIAFTSGMVVSIALGVIKAMACYAADGQMNCFSQSTLSYQLHPSYAAWYGCWVVGYWGYVLIRGDLEQRWLRRILLFVLPVIVLFTTMLASKSGMIGLGLLLVVLIWTTFVRLRGSVRRLVLAFTGLLVLAALWTQGPLMRARVEVAFEAFQKGLDGDDGILFSDEGSAMRMVAWSCSVDRMMLEPFGSGTGDIKHALMQCYTDKGAVEAAKRNLNSHSQFLQSGVALGWLGMILLVLLVAVALALAVNSRSVPLAVFVLLFVVNALVESVLEVQAGVVFFALFIGLLISERTSQTEDHSKEGRV